MTAWAKDRRWQASIPALAFAGLALLYWASGRPVQLVVDQRPETVVTHLRRVAEVLEEAGYPLAAHDLVVPAPSTRLHWGDGSIPVITLLRASPVEVTTDGSRQVVLAPRLDPADLIQLAGGVLQVGDWLEVNGLPWVSEVGPSLTRQIAHTAAVEVELLNGDGLQVIYSPPNHTLGEAVWLAGILLREGDRLTPSPETVVEGPLTAYLNRAQPLWVTAAARTIYGRSAAPTVSEALAELGLPLVGLDYSIPDRTGPLPADGQIRLVRVTEQVVLEQRPLPFETTYQPLESLEIDQRQLVQAGSYGVIAEQLRVRQEDGEEVGRAVEGQWIAQPPVDEIIGYGTQIVIRSVATPDGALEYWRAVQMYATSYSPSRAGIPTDHPWFGITASGKPLTRGLVAIDRSLIPFGTQMYVPGYGFAEAADTGGGVRGRWIDLGYDDDNYVPWHQYVTVYFLTPVPSASSIVYIFP